MNRFAKALAVLILALLLLASGVDATLDHLTRSTGENSYVVYNSRGHVVVAYTGDSAVYQAFTKPVHATPIFLHRT